MRHATIRWYQPYMEAEGSGWEHAWITLDSRWYRVDLDHDAIPEDRSAMKIELRIMGVPYPQGSIGSVVARGTAAVAQPVRTRSSPV